MIEEQGGEIVGTLELWLCRLMRKVIREEMAVKSEPPTSVGEQAFITVEKAASIAGVSQSSIRTWIRKGWIPAYRPGRLTRIRIHDLMMFMASGPPTDSRKITPGAVVADILERQKKRGG